MGRRSGGQRHSSRPGTPRLVGVAMDGEVPQRAQELAREGAQRLLFRQRATWSVREEAIAGAEGGVVSEEVDDDLMGGSPKLRPPGIAHHRPADEAARGPWAWVEACDADEAAGAVV